MDSARSLVYVDTEACDVSLRHTHWWSGGLLVCVISLFKPLNAADTISMVMDTTDIHMGVSLCIMQGVCCVTYQDDSCFFLSSQIVGLELFNYREQLSEH